MDALLQKNNANKIISVIQIDTICYVTSKIKPVLGSGSQLPHIPPHLPKTRCKF